MNRAVVCVLIISCCYAYTSAQGTLPNLLGPMTSTGTGATSTGSGASAATGGLGGGGTDAMTTLLGSMLSPQGMGGAGNPMGSSPMPAMPAMPGLGGGSAAAQPQDPFSGILQLIVPLFLFLFSGGGGGGFLGKLFSGDGLFGKFLFPLLFLLLGPNSPLGALFGGGMGGMGGMGPMMMMPAMMNTMAR